MISDKGTPSPGPSSKFPLHHDDEGEQRSWQLFFQEKKLYRRVWIPTKKIMSRDQTRQTMIRRVKKTGKTHTHLDDVTVVDSRVPRRHLDVIVRRNRGELHDAIAGSLEAPVLEPNPLRPRPVDALQERQDPRLFA